MTETAQQLGERAWDLYEEFAEETCVLTPSIPVLYFGNREAYEDSPRKVVTVGHNPSGVEFPDEEGPNRFETTRGERPFPRSYLDDLNGYFERNPYRNWFQHYEEVLNGLEASYYSDGVREGKEVIENRALHTDLHSPLATDPTWSGLNSKQQRVLAEEGERLWLGLIDLLEPDLILGRYAQNGEMTENKESGSASIGLPQTSDPTKPPLTWTRLQPFVRTRIV